MDSAAAGVVAFGTCDVEDEADDFLGLGQFDLDPHVGDHRFLSGVTRREIAVDSEVTGVRVVACGHFPGTAIGKAMRDAGVKFGFGPGGGAVGGSLADLGDFCFGDES